MESEFRQTTEHHEYYLNSGDVEFIAGNTSFKVYRYFFERESTFFRNLFACPTEDPQSGTNVPRFKLPVDVTPDEFAQLLWVWYDMEYSYQQQTKENWVVILQLSTRWGFPKIKELAIREISALRLPPAERIAIYNKHGINDDRLLDSYVEMCKSPTVPTEEEARLIQMEALINILQAREDAQRRAVELGHESPTSASLEDETLREIVSRFFRASLNPLSNGTSTGSGVQASNLNGKHAQGTNASETITLGEPQVPDRRTQFSKLSSHMMDKGKPRSVEEEDKTKPAGATQDKEKEEKEKGDKARQDKEKEEKAKQEKMQQDKEREENKQKAEEGKSSQSAPRKARGK